MTWRSLEVPLTSENTLTKQLERRSLIGGIFHLTEMFSLLEKCISRLKWF